MIFDGDFSTQSMFGSMSAECKHVDLTTNSTFIGNFAEVSSLQVTDAIMA